MSNFFKSSFFWFTTSAIVLLAVGLWLTCWQWEWLRSGGSETASNGDTLRNAGLMLAGLLALIFALWRGWVAEQQSVTARRQADIAQQSLLNERYERGAEMLGSPVLSVRLGGIYALRRLAEEHPELYHIQIMELFCAFLRNPTSSEESRDRENDQTLPPQTGSPVREDVQVVLTTVGDRTKVGLDIEEATGRFRLDLHNADLSRIHLPGANLAVRESGRSGYARCLPRRYQSISCVPAGGTAGACELNQRKFFSSTHGKCKPGRCTRSDYGFLRRKLWWESIRRRLPVGEFFRGEHRYIELGEIDPRGCKLLRCHFRNGTACDPFEATGFRGCLRPPYPTPA